MKIILSRKGFDSEYGGQPSPILPDGTLLSLPIPLPNERLNYNDLFYKEKSYYDIIMELKPKTKKIQPNCTCHLDPDIRKGILKRNENWKPIFGQADAAQMHLVNNKISEGDIFLFFGWFRETIWNNNKLTYKPGSPHQHIIYGYLQIGSIIKNEDDIPEYAEQHCHSYGDLFLNKTNCMYVARDKFTLNENFPGSSFLQFKQSLILTKTGMSRSKWQLPDFLRDCNITYHTQDSFKEDHFKSAYKGQEFIISAKENSIAKQQLIQWAKNIIGG